MERDGKQKCSNCKCWRQLEDFIGKSGDTVKRCLKCREKDAKQKKRPDVIEKRNKLQREKKYYEKYRENKRNENEEEYLKHNAKIAKEWRENNKEHVTQWRTNNFRYRFSGIKQQAEKKRINWDEELTDDICYNMMTSNCFYCGFLSESTLNGIDRLDSSNDYKKSNCVSCCKVCNFIKTCLDPITFIKRCKHITFIHSNGSKGELYKHENLWRNTKCASFKEYCKRASKKQLEFKLSEDDFNKLTFEKCFYCNKENSKTHKNGIDRLNNELGYTTENYVTSCGECNYMKSQLSFEIFIEQCKKITENETASILELENITVCLNSLQKTQRT